MPDSESKPGYVPNPYYTQADWDEVSSPELTDDQLAQMRPAAEALPELVAALRQQRVRQKAPSKSLFSLRVDGDVLEAYRATGPGWQSRMNDALRKSVGL
jgi:uncharacterized protein (DUF4415 family)